MHSPTTPLPVVVLISGAGTNLQALIDAQTSGAPIEMRAVISNRAGAPGLSLARQAGIPTHTIDHQTYTNREDFDAALMRSIDSHNPALVVLAGFMRILTPGFVTHYHGRMLNIHPSLLPKFRGLHTHQRAIDAGETEHGASVHFVTADLDSGQVVVQARVAVVPGESADTLARRVLEREHLIYPLAVEWYALGRLRHDGQCARFDDLPLTQPLDLDRLPPAEASA